MRKLKDMLTVPVDEEDKEIENGGIDARHSDKAIQQNARQKEVGRIHKVVSIQTTAQLQVVLIRLESFEEATSVAEHLNKKHTVLLNLESTSKDVSRRLLDFLGGVAYAIGGQLKKVSDNAFLITPYNVDIIGDTILDDLEKNGIGPF